MNKFSIEYPEYHIAGQLQTDFPRTANFSVSIPLSRQQKYYDLLLHNGNNKKCLAVQVKSSRTYVKTDIDGTDLKDYNYYAWLNNFKHTNVFTDFYFIFISYPLFDIQTFRPRTASGVKILVFDNEEMARLFASIKSTRSGNPDTFFGFGFNIDDNSIWGTRGFSQDPREEFTSHLYQNKVIALRQAIS
ncbi:MAG: hypothetical protein H0X70_02045 [Segetibacter sp.]|nr:hypothetical protein [Segetibacter sp.]